MATGSAQPWNGQKARRAPSRESRDIAKRADRAILVGILILFAILALVLIFKT